MERGQCQLLYNAVVVVGKVYGGAHLGCFLLEDGTRFGVGLPYHHGNAGFDDAGLFGSNLGQCVAQKLCVVEADIGDDAEERGDDIGAVEPPAHAYLHHGDVDLL